MRFDVLTLFPELVDTVCASSILGRAAQAGLIEVCSHNIRDYSRDKHRRVDDTPYGGGMGMLMAAPPVVECFEAVRRLTDIPAEKTKTVYLSPAGKLLTQKKALELAAFDRLILLCGHYEGVDERAVRLLSAEEISVGDYVLTGGELPGLAFSSTAFRERWRGSSPRRNAMRSRASPGGCWSIPSIRGRKATEGLPCRRCFFRAIIKGSSNSAILRRWKRRKAKTGSFMRNGYKQG